MVPYPSWLNAGDTSWQLTAATLVGLMSIPALAVLYGGLVQRKWAVNTMLMTFSAFCLVLIVWVLWVFKMGFGEPWIKTFVGTPGAVIGHGGEENRAHIPLVSGTGGMPPFRFPQSALVYFQFVFAAITPILFLGSVVGRISFKVWLIFVPLWSTFAYGVNAFLLWGGGWWAHQGALDFSGGYVIHLAAGTSGFVAAAVIGPRLKRDREHGVPNNLLLVGVGAGILWLGWNGFNGGDPYFASADAASAVLNTNLATAVAMMTWIVFDMLWGKERKPTFLGGVNGMIVGLVSITPAAGYVNGLGAIAIGFIACAIVWLCWNFLSRVRPFSRVDDALGVVYTHGFARLAGGLLVGFLADPKMVVYLGVPATSRRTARTCTRPRKDSAESTRARWLARPRRRLPDPRTGRPRRRRKGSRATRPRGLPSRWDRAGTYRPGPRRFAQCPRKASSSHHEPCSDVILASITIGRSRDPSSHRVSGARSPALRTVIPSQPNPRPMAAMSAGGNVTV